MVVTRKLNVTEPGPNYCHFPLSYNTEYFKQLTAEQVVSKPKGASNERVWTKMYEYNEAFDCRVYGYSAYKILFPHGVDSREDDLPTVTGKIKGLQ